MKTKSIIVAITLLASSLAFAADSGVPKEYPLKKCVVSGEELGGGDMTPYKITHEGTDVWLCCKSCEKKFKAAPAKFVKLVKDAQPKK